MVTDQPEVLTLEEAAKLLRVCKTTVKELATSGAFPYRMAGREWRFGRAALLRWINGDRAA